MPHVVDPRNLIDALLRDLAAKHEPGIWDLKRALSEAIGADVRPLKAQLRKAKRAYAAARRDVRRMAAPRAASF